MEILKNIIANILIGIYQPFWFSIISSVLVMFVYKKYSTVRKAANEWIFWFKTDSVFRRVFVWVFYTVMILFRTLLNRNMWANPVSNVIGTWGLYNAEGAFTTECIENLVLFIPFAFLLLCVGRYKILLKVTIQEIIWKITKITFLFSLTIEMLQLFLRLGTWQLSDLFYNTFGGVIGGLIYYIGYKVKHRRVKERFELSRN